MTGLPSGQTPDILTSLAFWDAACACWSSQPLWSTPAPHPGTFLSPLGLCVLTPGFFHFSVNLHHLLVTSVTLPTPASVLVVQQSLLHSTFISNCFLAAPLGVPRRFGLGVRQSSHLSCLPHSSSLPHALSPRGHYHPPSWLSWSPSRHPHLPFHFFP